MNVLYKSNSLLQSIVSKMLEENQKHRPSFIELQEALPSWDEVYQIVHNHTNPSNQICQDSVLEEKGFKIFNGDFDFMEEQEEEDFY